MTKLMKPAKSTKFTEGEPAARLMTDEEARTRMAEVIAKDPTRYAALKAVGAIADRLSASHKIGPKLARMTIKAAQKAAQPDETWWAGKADETAHEDDARVNGLLLKSATASKKRALKIDEAIVEAIPEPSALVLTKPLHAILKRRRFTFVKAERVGTSTAWAYIAKDRRAAMLTLTDGGGCAAWTIRWPDGGESGGTKIDAFAACAKVTVAQRDHAKLHATEKTMRAVERTAAVTAVVAAAAPGRTLPNGPADHVLHAIEMLGALTAKRYDPRELRGDKFYTERMALLRVLLARPKGGVKAAENTVATIEQALLTAVGTDRAGLQNACALLMADFAMARRAKKSYEKLTASRARKTVIVPGAILPVAKNLSRAARKAADDETKAYVKARAEEVSAVEFAEPNMLGEPAFDAKAMCIVEWKSGAHGVTLERFNSQGALQILDNGRRVAISVLTPTLLKGKDVTLRKPIDAVDLNTIIAILEESQSEKSERVIDVLNAGKRAAARLGAPVTFAPVDLNAKELRGDAMEEVVRIRPGGVRLLEDAVLGYVALQLEPANSQGALCVYNDSRRLHVGLVAPGVLASLRSAAGINAAEAAHQLLNPAAPSVPVTAFAECCLTKVKEMISMAKKFEGPKSAAKKAAKKAVKKAAGPAGERKSSLFRLKNDTKAVWSAFTTQKELIVKAFIKAGAVGAKAAGITRGQLIAALPDVPAPNISFYLSKWRPAGIIEKLAPAE